MSEPRMAPMATEVRMVLGGELRAHRFLRARDRARSAQLRLPRPGRCALLGLGAAHHRQLAAAEPGHDRRSRHRHPARDLGDHSRCHAGGLAGSALPRPPHRAHGVAQALRPAITLQRPTLRREDEQPGVVARRGACEPPRYRQTLLTPEPRGTPPRWFSRPSTALPYKIDAAVSTATNLPLAWNVRPRQRVDPCAAADRQGPRSRIRGRDVHDG